jgi:hypothetical protein
MTYASQYDYYKQKGADNPWAAQEIDLWINNTRPIYNQYMAFRDNYALKIQKGKFDKNLATKGLINLVKAAITHYNKQGYDERITLSQKDKAIVARSLFEDLWNEYLSKIKAEIPPKPTRRFNNETYKFLKRCKKKTEAERNKNRIIKAGKKCRIFSSKDGYDLYVRGR